MSQISVKIMHTVTLMCLPSPHHLQLLCGQIESWSVSRDSCLIGCAPFHHALLMSIPSQHDPLEILSCWNHLIMVCFNHLIIICFNQSHHGFFLWRCFVLFGFLILCQMLWDSHCMQSSMQEILSCTASCLRLWLTGLSPQFCSWWPTCCCCWQSQRALLLQPCAWPRPSYTSIPDCREFHHALNRFLTKLLEGKRRPVFLPYVSILPGVCVLSFLSHFFLSFHSHLPRWLP